MDHKAAFRPHGAARRRWVATDWRSPRAASVKPAAYNRRMSMSPSPRLVAELAAGRMVILVDEEDRENEGDLVLAADHVTPKRSTSWPVRPRVDLPDLTRERCERLLLPPMAARNGAAHGTAFTVSIEAAEGVTTGISAADRSRTVAAAVARDAKAIRPGAAGPHLPVAGPGRRRADARRAHRGRLRPGRHGRADAGAVICEIMNDDGTMAALPDLQAFAATHGLKIGTIADLIALPQPQRDADQARRRSARRSHRARSAWWSITTARAACTWRCAGHWSPADDVLVRVHEPFTVMDLLEVSAGDHSWPLPSGAGWPRCGSWGRRRGAAELRPRRGGADAATAAQPGAARRPTPQDLRTYGVGRRSCATRASAR